MQKPRKTLYENIQALRKFSETERVGHLYSEQNDIDIIQDALNGVSISQIAKKQKRTVSAIRQRIVMFAVNDMKLNNLTLNEISRKYHMKITLLSSYYQRVCEKENKVTKYIRDICNS